MEAIRALALSVDSDYWIVQVKRVRFEESEMNGDTVQHIHADASQHLTNQPKKLKATKDTRQALKTKDTVKI